MEYSFCKLYIARLKEGIMFRALLGVFVFCLGAIRELVITNTVTGEVIFISHLLSGTLSLLSVMILFSILRSIMIGIVIYGCYRGHKDLQKTYKEFVDNNKG